MMAKPELFTVRSAAKATGFCTKYIRDLLYEERLAGAKKMGRQWVIPAAAVAELKRRKDGDDSRI
jgi:hypothetical protein